MSRPSQRGSLTAASKKPQNLSLVRWSCKDQKGKGNHTKKKEKKKRKEKSTNMDEERKE
jgi:hypothetical protein